jgi:hypothetical protein
MGFTKPNWARLALMAELFGVVVTRLAAERLQLGDRTLFDVEIEAAHVRALGGVSGHV